MQVIMMIVQLFQRTAISYGKMLMLIGTLIEEGGSVVRSTLEVLGQEKYAAIKAHFQAGVLHLIAAASEFKKGGLAADEAIRKNPEDFKLFMEFKAKLKKDLPKSLEECFQGMEDIIKGADFTVKVPAFVRQSGEYMDLVNQGCTEVDEKTFKELLVKANIGAEEFLIQDLIEAAESIRTKGWAELAITEDSSAEGEMKHYILWADSFDYSDMIPAWVKPVEKREDLGYTVDHIRAGGKIYRVPVLRRMTAEQIEELKADSEAFFAKLKAQQDSIVNGGWDLAGAANDEKPEETQE